LSHIGAQHPVASEDIHRVDSIGIGENGFRPSIDKFRRFKPFAFTIPNYLEFIADVNKAMDTILMCCRKSPQSRRFSATLCHFILKRTNNYVFVSLLAHYDSANSVYRSIDHDLD